MTASARPIFPFSALVGQERLQLALLLAAVDPGIGGVLVTGPRGTAKSTAARALAELLPHGHFVTLPLGASEEQLTGTLDLGHALQEGQVRFAPGLLARAHEGVLYVDEVNLLPDPLVDQLLDVAASGVNVVERDGVSHQHEARFVLVGTMNPEEGDLRPQLLDRFGLALALGNYDDPVARQAIVRARLAFDADPRAFRASVEAGQRALAERVVQARHRLGLASLSFDDAVHARVSTLCIDAAVDGVRADLVMLRTARALAAWDMAPALTTAHVDAVAELVLYHRRQAPPADASPGTTPEARTGTSPSTPPGTPPAIPPGSHAAPGSRPAGPARMQGAASAGAANPTAEGSEGGEVDDWGALSAPAPAADAIPVAQVKPLRPFGKLPPKKA
ncbi:ATP-binding protein [Cupriavidus plantarum]|uniref:Protoporphyrin IX magnesium-chelatase n=1 Tax=Cupriavidus plantarum TaxID=942865 RepID=A0A316ESL6_9BURK|nr:ATP-binding protein [Cupriavidus plantarum]PWK35364.1 protoporphyrin IX magnesium-chelatase [Cupriavidus plantarum]